jgi:hypothetical protein
MNAPRWDFLLFMTLVAGAATTALGQTVAPDIGQASSAAQSAASIPDVSGMWTHPYLPGFEPPASGPGPVTNRSRKNGVSNNDQFVGDYTNPILKPEAAEIVKQRGEIALKGIIGDATPNNQCWPEPMPYILSEIAIQLLQQPDKITIIYLRDHQVRHVRMNQSHPARVTPSWYGDSVGRYEGDTLVIDTVGIKTDRPFAMVDRYGTPYTEALHVVERYRLLDYEAAKEGLERNAKENSRPGPSIYDWAPNYRGKHLQLHFTVEDEGVFRMPWSATITYGRPIDDSLEYEYVCAENIRWYPGENAAVPTADEPDF